MPTRTGASTFSFSPPIGKKAAQRDFPVMAVSLRTVRPLSSDASAMNMATPSLGLSFGTAPAGT
jgi:hypothetical protein